MKKDRYNVAVLEPSEMVFKGLSNILLKSDSHFSIYGLTELDELPSILGRQELDYVIINPSFIQHRLKDLKKLRGIQASTKWIGLIYNIFPQEILQFFDLSISITDPGETIVQNLQSLIQRTDIENNTQEQLSERETEVLLQIVQGLSNKEIADKLNISIHTVISHRKNIIQKTGIKSQSGLTIFAITQKLITLDHNL